MTERTPYTERRTPIQDVLGTASNGERTFIYTGPVSAYVIPHRAVTEGELEALVEALRMMVPENPPERD